MKFKFSLPHRKPKSEPPLYFDLRLTQVDDIWFWEVYHEGKRVQMGRTRGGIRAAFHDAKTWAEPNKIVTAGVNRRKDDA